MRASPASLLILSSTASPAARLTSRKLLPAEFQCRGTGCLPAAHFSVGSKNLLSAVEASRRQFGERRRVSHHHGFVRLEIRERDKPCRPRRHPMPRACAANLSGSEYQWKYSLRRRAVNHQPRSVQCAQPQLGHAFGIRVASERHLPFRGEDQEIRWVLSRAAHLRDVGPEVQVYCPVRPMRERGATRCAIRVLQATWRLDRRTPCARVFALRFQLPGMRDEAKRKRRVPAAISTAATPSCARRGASKAGPPRVATRRGTELEHVAVRQRAAGNFRRAGSSRLRGPESAVHARPRNCGRHAPPYRKRRSRPMRRR